jgi:hypothetical protein
MNDLLNQTSRSFCLTLLVLSARVRPQIGLNCRFLTASIRQKPSKTGF